MKVHVLIALYKGLMELEPRVFTDLAKVKAAEGQQRKEYGIVEGRESDNAVYLFENIEVE